MPDFLHVSVDLMGSFTDRILVEMVTDESALSTTVLVNVVPTDILYFQALPFSKLKYELLQGTRGSGAGLGVLSTAVAWALATWGVTGVGKNRSFRRTPTIPTIDSAIDVYKRQI